MTARSVSRLLLPILAILYVLGFSNLFLRGSLGVLGPRLAIEMQLSPSALATVASAFFFAYAAMQIPTGALFDRFGPRRTLSVMLLFTTAGSAVFALASSSAGLVVGRVLMGIGCAGIFTGAFYVLAQWLPADRVVSQSGALNGFAAIGNLMATTPLAALIAAIGWRESYWIFAAWIALLLVLIAAVLRDAPPDLSPRPATGESLSKVLEGVRRALATPGMPRLMVAGFPMAATSALTGVWGAPYLRDVHQLDEIARGNILLAMALTGMFGHVLFGQMARLLNSLRTSIVIGAIAIIASMTAMAALPQPPLWLVMGLFCLMVLGGSYPTITMAHGRGLVAPDLIGRGVSVSNMGTMTAIASMQFLFGWIVGMFPVTNSFIPEIAYRTAFAVMALVGILALTIYAPIKDVRPR